MSGGSSSSAQACPARSAEAAPDAASVSRYNQSPEQVSRLRSLAAAGSAAAKTVLDAILRQRK